MIDSESINVLRRSFRFSLDIMDFYDELVDQKKAPIAKRILYSSLHGLCWLQRSIEAEKPQESKEYLANAIINFKNVIYWLEQCEKSGYLFKEKLLRKAIEIYSYCTSKAH
jgi:hypothetical protein